MRDLAEALARIRPLDGAATAAARDRLDRLAKPPGSLGRLEDVLVQLAGITGDPAPGVAPRQLVVAAADHGVALRHRVSAWPSEVTAQMVAAILSGRAAVSPLSRAARATVVLIDVGVASPIPAVADGVRGARLVSRRVRRATADLSAGPAMRVVDVERAVGAGLDAARSAAAAGIRLLGVGEIGIGNTTAASAVVAGLTGAPAPSVTGRGAGVDERGWVRKVALVERALAVNRVRSDDPIGVLTAVGGLEIAALVGVIAGAAAARVPVILDGFITSAAALVAARLQPALPPRLIAAHRSKEPGHGVVLDALGLRPLLELEMGLGEGTGAALAMLLIAAAAGVRDRTATLAAAGVSPARAAARTARPDRVGGRSASLGVARPT